MAQPFNIEATMGDDGDWTNTSNYVGAAIPIDNDRVLVRNTSFDLTTLSGQGAVDLERLEFDQTVTHKIGGSGDRLTLDVQSDAAAADGPGYLIYAGAGSEAWFTVDTRKFIAKHRKYTNDACVLKHRTNNIDEVMMYDGHTRLDGGTYLLVNMVASASLSARCIIDAGSTVTTVNATGGVVACSTANTLTTCNVAGTGEFQHLAAQAITTLNIYGGIFRFDGAATITTINQYGGLLDLSRTAKNRVVTLYNGYGGELNLLNSGTPDFVERVMFGPVRIRGGEHLRAA